MSTFPSSLVWAGVQKLWWRGFTIHFLSSGSHRLSPPVVAGTWKCLSPQWDIHHQCETGHITSRWNPGWHTVYISEPSLDKNQKKMCLTCCNTAIFDASPVSCISLHRGNDVRSCCRCCHDAHVPTAVCVGGLCLITEILRVLILLTPTPPPFSPCCSGLEEDVAELVQKTQVITSLENCAHNT